MNRTSIEWCDYSVNPIRPEVNGKRKGWFCAKVSAGCANCYAERMNMRCNAKGNGIGNGLRFTRENEAKVRFVLDEKALRGILKSRAPAGSRVFVGDMTDLFHTLIPFDLLDNIFTAMALRPDLTFMLLTKRPERMLEYCSGETLSDRIKRIADCEHGKCWLGDKGRTVGPRLPLPNVQLGVSIEDQATADERIPLLLQTPAAVRFVSYEPALGPVDLSQWLDYVSIHDEAGDEYIYKGVKGVIAGGESGPNARPANPDWFRQVRDDCAAAGVPFFFKQWGEWREQTSDKWVKYKASPSELSSIGLLEPHGRFTMVPDLPVYPEEVHCTEVDCWMQRVGKKAAGRALDGRYHDALPVAK
ncbi:MAG: phage Gp37/Gp68 family protein [Rhodopirellula sp.]|nr:phage Gp37/Gp68 family protein [Rhodopirellula sp.]